MTTTDPTDQTTTGETTADTTTGDTTIGDTTTGDTTGTETDRPVCESKPGADQCELCVSEMCCAPLRVCYLDPDCACLVDCINELGLDELQQCQKFCSIEGLPPPAAQLAACQAAMCGDPCSG